MAYPRALDLRWRGMSGGRISLLLPYASRIADAEEGAVDVRAVFGALDQACSAAVYASLREPQLIATADLRVEFADRPTVGADVVCDAWAVWSDKAWVLTRAEARCAQHGRPIAFASSSYAKGSHPGAPQGAVPPSTATASGPLPKPSPEGGFEGLLGLRRDLDCTVMPFREEIIGAPTLPSLHGGATGALLASAALQLSTALARDPAARRRLLTISVQYLRAAQARETKARAERVKAGARMDVLTVVATQDNETRAVARAECVVTVGG